MDIRYNGLLISYLNEKQTVKIEGSIQEINIMLS